MQEEVPSQPRLEYGVWKMVFWKRRLRPWGQQSSEKGEGGEESGGEQKEGTEYEANLSKPLQT